MGLNQRVNDEFHARQLLINSIPFFNINKCIEYKNLYIFDGEPSFLGFVSVDKNTGIVGGFNPLSDDSDEFFKEWDKETLKKTIENEGRKFIEKERVLK